MTKKQMRKLPLMAETVSRLNPVQISGNREADRCLIAWGSNAPPLCREAAGIVGITFVQPLFCTRSRNRRCVRPPATPA
ncbi:hypothetical protein [Methanogenium cariaci]|uniref:hypothetical protein n=1 Tax=Methanogenium cariaci TaxID=2197 RepID=UPI0012F64331|nr:hypothetical protein [Methanogenium cariaci]